MDEVQREATGRVLKGARARAGLSQEELAKELGVERDVIGRRERGDVDVGLKLLTRWCAVLGIDPREVIGG